MVSVKLKIVKGILRVLKKIVLRLLNLRAKYEAEDLAVKKDSFDLRKLPERIKKLVIHDKDVVESRLSECEKCEHFINPTSQCKKCGCFMKIKTKFSTTKCPIGKWGKYVAPATV